MRAAVSCALGLAVTAGLLAGTTGPAQAGTPTGAAPASATTEETTPETGEAASEEEALVQAARTGSPVEVVSLRGETSEVYAQPDGTLQAREYLRPVRARVDGQWQSIDTDLVPTDDGMVAPAVATVDLAFSGGGTDDPLVRMSRAGRTLELRWPGTLPAPELDGSDAVYRDVLPDVDLRMGAGPDGFTQLLIVNSEEAAHSDALAELVLGLDAEGMDVEVTPEGGLAAIDHGAGNPVFEAPAPLMWDSSTGTDDPSAAARTAAAAATEEVPAGESARQGRVDVEVTDTHLALTPDPEILRGEDTQYPVYIDPQWESPRTSAWTMASRYWHDTPQWKFNGEDNAGLGYCGWSYCMPYDLKRLFYRIPTTRFAGTEILSATFVVRNVWSASCTGREVQLWRTHGINSGTTWDTQNESGFWIERLDSRVFAYGYEGCGARDAEFDVRSAVQDAADGGWPDITFGMQATSESDPYTWKRFSDAAYLRVNFNRPPHQIRTSQLAMEIGGPCRPWSNPARVNALGDLLAANVTDPDGERERISVQFRAFWDTGDGRGNIARWTRQTSTDTSGSSFSIGLPSVPRNVPVQWEARTYDGTDEPNSGNYSPWSSNGSATRCTFIYDNSAPAAPSVTSPEYPAINPANPEDPWRDGVGKYGNFTFDTTATDVTEYQYTFTTGDTQTTRAVRTSNGDPRTVRLLPQEPGGNMLVVTARDAAGNASASRTYIFRVRSGTPERAVWNLDEAPGASAAAGQGAPWPAELSGDATPGATGVRGSALHLGGTDGHARTTPPVLDTSKSFTVSLWARLPETGVTTTGTAVSQAGNATDGFRLSVDPGTGGWSFGLSATDSASATVARARQNTAAALGRWTHVAAVVGFPSREVVLYIDGQRAGSAAITGTGWEARGATAIGARLAGTTASQFFNGDLDEVHFYDYGLGSDQIAALTAHRPVTQVGRPAVAIWSFEESADATEVDGRAQAVNATVNTGVTFGQAGMRGTSAAFNGAPSVAATSQPVLDTYQSFAVSAWVKPANLPNQTMVVAAQTADVNWGFALVHAPGGRGWALRRWTAGDDTGTQVEASECPTTTGCTPTPMARWTHVVGVNDLDRGEIRIYVNGELVGSAPFTSRWASTGRFTIGAADHHEQGLIVPFNGQIDDLRVFDRVVSDDEVAQLYRQTPEIAGRWTFETATSGTTPDASVGNHPLTLNGGAAIAPGRIGVNALTLDGVDDYAAGSTVPIEDTSHSFSVSAWTQAAAAPSRPATVVSAPGAQHSAFAVRFLPDPDYEGRGEWQIALPNGDAANATVARVVNTRFLDVRRWNHIALVYDGFQRQARLFVNGQLQEVACLDETDDDCGSVSWADNVVTYRATQSLQVGRNRTGSTWSEYWPGVIDDLWVFQGALTNGQVRWLSGALGNVPTELPNIS